MMKKKNFLFKSSSSPELSSSERDYNNFTQLLNKKMGNYCKDKDSNQTDFEKTKKLLYYSKIKINRDEKEFINKVGRNKIDVKKYITNYSTNNSKINSSDNLFNYSKNSNMSISIPRETFYFSPLHSLGVLKLNSLIYSDVLKTNLNRQKLIYDNSIKINNSIN